MKRDLMPFLQALLRNPRQIGAVAPAGRALCSAMVREVLGRPPGLVIDHAGASAGDLAGYRWAFLFMALLPVATWFWIRTVPDHERVVQPAGRTANRAWDLMREPTMRRLLLVNWCLSSCWDVHTFILPVIGHERGFSASVIGTILGGFAIAAALIRVVMPLFASRLRENIVIAGAMVVAAAVFAVYPLMQGAWAMGVCSVVLGLALGSVQPMVMSTLHQITPDARHGEALGLRLMTINASSVAMPMLFGGLGAAVGVAPLFWAGNAVVGRAIAGHFPPITLSILRWSAAFISGTQRRNACARRQTTCSG